MSGSAQVSKEFETPDRGAASAQSSSMNSLNSINDSSSMGANDDSRTSDLPKPNTVTPPECSSSREDSAAIKKEATDVSPLQIDVDGQVDSPDDGNKQVRFDSDSDPQESLKESPNDSPDSSGSSGSKRGLVSRRGGRCASPGRITGKPSAAIKETVLEFKTYRSPQRVKRDESESGLDQKGNSGSSAVQPQQEDDAAKVKQKDRSEDSPTGDRNSTSNVGRTTSPPASLDANKTQDPKSGQAKGSSGRQDSVQQTRKNNVSFSPQPPVRTPTRSPTRGHFQTLPSLDDAALKSPVGIFLSPHPPTPSAYRSTEEIDADAKVGAKEDEKPASKPERRPDETKALVKSPKTRDQERERFVATPTDFSTDYGKGHSNLAAFDTSNVLSWLQSPTANGLFSPGGYLGSIMNTPRGGASLGLGPRTPRTPTVSTSFFFSDAADLPRSGDSISPKPGGNEHGKRGGSQRGLSNIICISPLASRKNGSSNQAASPINYKTVFASPGDKNNPRNLPELGDSPTKGMKARGPQRTSSRDPSLDAVHMAERDLMEDEDLSVLLQLANTPRSAGERPPAVSTSDGTHVFRSPNVRNPQSGTDENLPSLQLPIINGREHESNGARLSRKTHSRDHNESREEFKHAPIGMRPGYIGEQNDEVPKAGKGVDDKRKQGSKSSISKKASKKSNMPPAPHHYSMGHPPYPHPGADVPYYASMPPGMPPGGSMRVVVNSHPPPRAPPKSSGSPHSGPHGPGSPHGHRPYPIGPSDPNYPPPPYPPPPGHYGHHPGVHPPHMQGVPPPHPYHGHYPPPHHTPRPPLPLYGSSHPPPGKSKSPKKLKPSKPTKPGAKRPAPPLQGKTGSATKKKKTSTSGGAPKRKNKSPQSAEKGERQKSVASMQGSSASGAKNDRAAQLAAAILRGVTMRPSGKWQAQLYFAGKSRYIGVFDTREKAALAYEIAREKLKSEKSSAEQGGGLTPKATEAAVNSARKAAFEGVNERDPRIVTK